MTMYPGSFLTDYDCSKSNLSCGKVMPIPLFFPVSHNLNTYVHEAHGHRTSPGHVEVEKKVDSKGTTVAIVVATFA